MTGISPCLHFSDRQFFFCSIKSASKQCKKKKKHNCANPSLHKVFATLCYIKKLLTSIGKLTAKYHTS